MKLSSKLLLRIVLPVLALLTALAALYREQNYGRATNQLRAELARDAELLAELLDFQIERVDGVLSGFLGGLDQLLHSENDKRIDPVIARGRLQRFLDRTPGLLGVELYHVDGTPIVAAVAIGETPHLVSTGMLAEALTRRRILRWESSDRLRVVRPARLGAGGAPVLASVLLDYEMLAAPVAAMALRNHVGTCVTLSPPDGGQPLVVGAPCKHTADEDLIDVASMSPAVTGSVGLHHSRRTALAGIQMLELQAVVGFGLILLLLMATLWKGLNSIVLRPVRGILRAVDAFHLGHESPPRSTDSRDEIGALDDSLRLSFAAVERSQGELAALNNTLESRVEERTGQLRLYADELKVARDDAQSAVMTRMQFVSNMSHEIRTPLNGIIGMSSLLLDTEMTPEQNEYADAVRRSGEELLSLVNNVLDFSAYQHAIDLEEVDFDLRETLADLTDLIAEDAQAKRIELACDVAPALPRIVRGDVGRLRQVLSHLLNNAIKFTDSGEVVVRAVPETEHHEAISIRFEVQDTGIGIAPEAHDALFEPFTQADGSTTRRHGGTGLGLAVCRLLVEAMHGTIGMSSVRGDGSRFWFTARFGKTADENDTSAATRELEGLSVLIVDDNETNRLILSRETEAWGMQATEAVDGHQALELASGAFTRGAPYDLVLLDMLMPGMDGLDVAASFAADPALATIPIIMLTSAVGPEEAPAVDHHGILARLSKPVRRQHLLECILRVLHSHAPWAHRSPLPPTRSRGTDSRRVLVVEDNVVNQKVAVRMLERLGFRADVAGNGLEACHAIDRMPYGAILMDCQMPVMDGFKATAEIRRRMKVDDRIPIIAMTAHAMIGDRERMLEADMDDYLSKPVLREDLARVLERWLPNPDEEPASGDPMTTTQEDGPRSAIDSSALDELRQLDDSAEILGELIDIYLEDTPQRLDALARAVADGDALGIRDNAHSLKSSCAQLGAAHLSDLCRQLETLGKDAELGPTASLIAEALAEFPRVQAALAAEKAGSA